MEEAISMDPLHTRQHGFRADRSTETAISDMTNYIEKYLFNKRHCVGIFLDISSAFDTISPKHIRETLLKKGGDPIMVEWYHGYLTHRNHFLELNNDTTSATTSIGFPKGGFVQLSFGL